MKDVEAQSRVSGKVSRERSYQRQLNAIEIKGQEDGGTFPTEEQHMQRHRTTKQDPLEKYTWVRTADSERLLMRAAKDESKEGGLPSRPSNCALHTLSGVTGETA